jgi:hypothetical protein
MNCAVKPEAMALEQDRQFTEVVQREHSRLRNFIRRRLPCGGVVPPAAEAKSQASGASAPAKDI